MTAGAVRHVAGEQQPRRGSGNRHAIVVGAGPAGATAAILLSRRGWSVTLVDRALAGRPKCCGHCLSGVIVPRLRSMGLVDVVDAASLGELRSLRLEVASPNGASPRVLTTELPADHAGRLIDRPALDRALMDAAVQSGVEVLRPASVAMLESTPDGTGAQGRRRGAGAGADGPRWRVAVEHSTAEGRRRSLLECDLLVGADGLGSGVARRLGWADPRPGRAFGFSTDVPSHLLPALPPGEIRMHVVSDGYLGVARADDRSTGQGVGIHIGALVRGGAARRDPRAFVSEMARRFPALAPLASVADGLTCVGAGPMPWRARCVAAAGVALIGDAAAFVEPFTGDGMAWAFESAGLLAESLGGSKVAGTQRCPDFDPRAAERYRHAWTSAIGRGHRRCGLAAALVERPAFLAAGVGVVPGLARAAVRWLGAA